MKTVLFLAIIVLAILCLRLYKKSSTPKENRHISRFSEEISLLIEETKYLSGQDTAMPFQIFQLAGKFAPYPNKDEIIAAIDYIYNMDAGPFGFGRRVSLTTLRFIGAYHYSVAAQNTVDYLILRGLEDRAVWVQYDAAWVATTLRIQNPDIITKLEDMKSVLNSQETETESPEDKLRVRVNEFFE